MTPVTDGKGLRYDSGKVRYDLLPPEWEHALAEILTAGAAKYADRNWELGMSWSKMVGCSRRHINAWRKGEMYDTTPAPDGAPGTGCHHLALAAWNLLALMSYQLREVGENDLPQPKMNPTRVVPELLGYNDRKIGDIIPPPSLAIGGGGGGGGAGRPISR